MDPDSIDTTERAVHGGTENQELLDFSANTNPRTPIGTRTVYETAFEDTSRYPDDEYSQFRTAAADFLETFHDVTWDQDNPAIGGDAAREISGYEQIIPTPGGLAAIRLAISCLVTPGDSALVPAPSFAEYKREIRLHGASPVFRSREAILEADPEPHALAIVCTPNNPTGELADYDTLLSFAKRCRECDTPLLVDEAFLGFVDAPSIAGQPGVITVRSLTKLFGLPGIRMGYAVASGALRDRLQRARRPWNLSIPAARVGTHCLTAHRLGDSFLTETRDQLRQERKRLWPALSAEFDIVTPAPPAPAGPYFLLDVSGTDRTVDEVVETAEEHGVAIRDARSFRGLDSHVRVAIKDEKSNDQMLTALTGRD